MKNTSALMSILSAGLLFAWNCHGDADIVLSGRYLTDVDRTCTSNTRVLLNGVTFTDCTLKLRGDVTYTLVLGDGTQNVFQMLNENKECIKATKKSNLVITGTGALNLVSEKRITDEDDYGNKLRSGVLVCNNLTVEGGDTTVTFDTAKSDTSCIFLKGNYLQTGGKMKVDLKKKNCTNEFHGVTFDSKDTTFVLNGGKFNAEIAGTKSRAIDLKGSCTATFTEGEVKAEFEGPEGRFVNGGTIVFNGGQYVFTTNITSKLTTAYYPNNLSAVKAGSSITINGGDFEADLPLVGSEVFTTDSTDGTFIDIKGGTFDLVAGDDCISANGDILISGGRIRAVSVFDDALDANGGMMISGGDIRAYATGFETHGLDVNKGNKLTISGGIVVATDGVDAERIGSGSPEVGKVSFVQPTYYGMLPTDAYSAKYLCLEGATNGVPIVVKPRLPAFPAGRDFNLLVSVPGRSASPPAAKTVSEAYSDVNSRTPIVFEKKASLADHTLTTKEGDVLTVPSYYDLEPAEGKSKTFSLTLNALAAPEYADLATDGLAAIDVAGTQVNVGVKTRAGLKYQLVTAPECTTLAPWTCVGEVAEGTGAARALVAPRTGDKAFYRVRVSD